MPEHTALAAADWRPLHPLPVVHHVALATAMSDELPPPPPYLLPATLEEARVRCRYCSAIIRWGKTIKGKRAPFDFEPPHVNHFSTCPRAKKVTADYKERG